MALDNMTKVSNLLRTRLVLVGYLVSKPLIAITKNGISKQLMLAGYGPAVIYATGSLSAKCVKWIK